MLLKRWLSAIQTLFAGELAAAARWIRGALEGSRAAPAYSQILVHTRYNCDG